MTGETALPERADATEPVLAHARDGITGVLVDPARPLLWRRTVPLAPDFELRQGAATFGEMEPSSSAALDAAGECLGRTLGLRLERDFVRGFRVGTVRASEETGPSYRGLSLGWGVVTATSGERLRWRHSFRGLYAHVLVDSQGVGLLRLQPIFLRFARTETKVLLGPGAWTREDLPELLLLTWFLRVHIEARGRSVFRRSKRRLGRRSFTYDIP